jgi:signal transduction histidine kinase
MLQVVVENLVENAIRYAGDGVTCTIACRGGAGGRAIEVRDNGAGVAAEELPRLFERFYRGDRGRSTAGTGLGLAIVKHVAAAAGASVEAYAAEPHGLAIRIAFPA